MTELLDIAILDNLIVHANAVGLQRSALVSKVALTALSETSTNSDVPPGSLIRPSQI